MRKLQDRIQGGARVLGVGRGLKAHSRFFFKFLDLVFLHFTYDKTKGLTWFDAHNQIAYSFFVFAGFPSRWRYRELAPPSIFLSKGETTASALTHNLKPHT